MRIWTIMVVLVTLALCACEDDPIIGPTSDDTSGGGSYGVMHFEAIQEEPSNPPVDQEAPKRTNPERF